MNYSSRWILLLVGLLLGTPVIADETKDDSTSVSKVTDAQEQEKELSRDDRVSNVMKELSQQMTAFQKAYLELRKTETDRAELQKKAQKLYEEKYPKPADFVGKMMAIVDEDATDDAALRALTWLMRNSRGPGRNKVLELFKEHHFESKQLQSVCLSLMRGPYSLENIQFLEEAIEKNPHDEVKGVAIYALAQLKKQRLRPGDSDAEAELEELLTRAVEEYGDVEFYERTIRQIAEGELFEMKYLLVGKEVPDIEGEDIDGVQFKLSDYRGKIVFLDFWGNW